MSVTLTGSYPVINRKRTGLHSLDYAISSGGYVGWPMRTVTEIYGYTNSGKSTLAYYLAAKLAEQGKVTVCDLELLDAKYIHSIFTNVGFSGELNLVDSVYSKDDPSHKKKKGDPRSHEQMLNQMCSTLYDTGTKAAIWDSLSQTTSLEEATGDFGEAFWGKRAKLNNQVARRIGSIMRNKEDEAIMIGVNHIKGLMGGKGHTTPGGEDFKDVSAIRIMLWTDTVWRVKAEDTESEPIGFQVGGQIEKLRFGGRGRKFKFYIIPGFGVHVGASAMFDCFDLGLAEQGATVKVGGKSLGYIRKDLLSYAVDGKQRKFEPFLELLADYEKKQSKEIKQDE